MSKDFDRAINNCDTVREVFELVDRFYNIDEKLTVVQKVALQVGIKKSIKILSLKEKF